MKRPTEALRPSCERRDDRYMLAEARLEWRDAEGGIRAFQILDASRRGICFGLDDGATPPAEGTEMRDVVLDVGGLKIQGRLIVMQWIESTSRGATCGGEFHPASFDDAARYGSVIKELEQRSRLRSMS